MNSDIPSPHACAIMAFLIFWMGNMAIRLTWSVAARPSEITRSGLKFSRIGSFFATTLMVMFYSIAGAFYVSACINMPAYSLGQLYLFGLPVFMFSTVLLWIRSTGNRILTVEGERRLRWHMVSMQRRWFPVFCALLYVDMRTRPFWSSSHPADVPIVLILLVLPFLDYMIGCHVIRSYTTRTGQNVTGQP